MRAWQRRTAAAEMRAPFALRRGANLQSGGVCFSVWAPHAPSLDVRTRGPFGRTYPMVRDEHGLFQALVPGIGAGTDYVFVFPDGRERPDPVSRWQPAGVLGPS